MQNNPNQRRTHELVGAKRHPSPDERWRRRAACRGVDPELFYPLPGESPAAAAALATCAGCPVREECLASALAGREPGIWGGTTARDRQRLRRQWHEPAA